MHASSLSSTRSLHETDPYDLFSASDDEEEEEEGKGESGKEDGNESHNSSGSIGSQNAAPRELPDNVLRMLDMMKITRLDKVRP